MAIAQSAYWAGLEPMCSHINIGTGKDCSIRELAELLQNISGFQGKLVFDSSQPEGTLLKRLDVSKLSDMEFFANINLVNGLAQTWHWYAQYNPSVQKG